MSHHKGKKNKAPAGNAVRKRIFGITSIILAFLMLAVPRYGIAQENTSGAQTGDTEEVITTVSGISSYSVIEGEETSAEVTAMDYAVSGGTEENPAPKESKASDDAEVYEEIETITQDMPSLTVIETDREDKPEGLESAAAVSPGASDDGRYIVITSSDGDTLRQLLSRDYEYREYNIITYDISYIDESGKEVPSDEWNSMTINLTIPPEISYREGSLRIVAVGTDGTLETDIPQSLTEETVNFVTDHFSEYGMIYLDPLPSYTVYIDSVNPENSGYVLYDDRSIDSVTVQAGTAVTLVASPASGYRFSNWTEGGVVISTDPTYTFAVTGNRHLVAVYEPAPTTDPRYGNSGTSDSGASASSGTGTSSDSSNAASSNASGTATSGTANASASASGASGDSSNGSVNAASGNQNQFAGTSNVIPTDQTGVIPPGGQVPPPGTPEASASAASGAVAVPAAPPGGNGTDMPRTGASVLSLYWTICAVLLFFLGSIMLLSSFRRRG